MSERKQPRVDYGHLAFVGAVLAFILWFLIDAWTASARLENLMLIVPTTLVAFVAASFVLVAEIRRIRDGATEREPVTAIDVRIPLFMVAVSTYVVALVYVGFDVATFAFLAVSLWLLGERRLVVVLGYSLLMTVFSVYGLREMLSVPVPTLLGGS